VQKNRNVEKLPKINALDLPDLTTYIASLFLTHQNCRSATTSAHRLRSVPR